MRKYLPVLVASLLFITPTSARADWLLTPYLGLTFGGDSENEQLNFGGSIAYLGGGILGVELDAAITPNFFDTDDDTFDDIEDSNVSTVMGNLILSIPMQNAGVRPYVVAGGGIIRSRVTSVGNVFDVDDNSFGINIGGGIVGQFNPRVGIRGDVRYFRNVQDSEEGDDTDIDLGGFNFWRATLGVAFRF
jgi:hypothetical protein